MLHHIPVLSELTDNWINSTLMCYLPPFTGKTLVKLKLFQFSSFIHTRTAASYSTNKFLIFFFPFSQINEILLVQKCLLLKQYINRTKSVFLFRETRMYFNDLALVCINADETFLCFIFTTYLRFRLLRSISKWGRSQSHGRRYKKMVKKWKYIELNWSPQHQTL